MADPIICGCIIFLIILLSLRFSRTSTIELLNVEKSLNNVRSSAEIIGVDNIVVSIDKLLQSMKNNPNANERAVGIYRGLCCGDNALNKTAEAFELMGANQKNYHILANDVRELVKNIHILGVSLGFE